MNNEFLTLYELNKSVSDAIKGVFDFPIWITAEINNISSNYSGHIYLELIEKDKSGDKILAQSRAIIWASNAEELLFSFEEKTQSELKVGLKVKICVLVEFHVQYSMSLNIIDIDADYTIGELLNSKLLVIKQLKEDGIYDDNKSLDLNIAIKNIAVISSQTAAGYQDFYRHLSESQFKFNVVLFNSIMQGNNAVESIIQSLEDIFNSQIAFDCLVIIRGGGAKTDLVCFDSYELNSILAQFPIPILSGIGHDRDQTVVDLIAHTALKTPTAVADFIISYNLDLLNKLQELGEGLFSASKIMLEKEDKYLKELSLIISSLYSKKIRIIDNILISLNEKLQAKTAISLYDYFANIDKKYIKLNYLSAKKISEYKNKLEYFENNLENSSSNFVRVKQLQINNLMKNLEYCNPINILKKGYSITIKDGKIVRSIKDIAISDKISTILPDGEFSSEILSKKVE